jgi:hypothetical protein
MMMLFDDAARIDLSLDSRSISFENPTGARGKGGSVAKGRKGSPSRLIKPGEKVTLADIEGPGRIRHIWMTFPPAAPEQMRGVWMEVFYDGRAEPSISVPCLDFFGLPLGRVAPYYSALTSAQEGRGFNAYFPMPFAKHVRIELTHSGTAPISLYYQIDYTLEKVAADAGYLHVSFRRDNPTTLKKDFVIAKDLHGPGRFLGCAIGIRVLQDGQNWYGEGEFKVYRDGDTDLPTICGTGLEDYVGSAWGMDRHTALYAGVPVHVKAEQPAKDAPMSMLPDFVGFYRWHLPDPIVFNTALTATIQQIGAVGIDKGPDASRRFQNYVPAGTGWNYGPGVETTPEMRAMLSQPENREVAEKIYAFGIAERVDDYCAAAFVYCREPQSVPRLDVKLALADIGLRPYEKAPKLS